MYMYGLSVWCGCWSVVYIRRFFLQFFKWMSFRRLAVAVSRQVGPVNRLITPVWWLLLLQLTVLSRAVIPV